MIKLRVLGIDLGTSLCSAALIEDGKAVPLRIGTAASLLIGDSYCMPSSVFVEENGGFLLGQAADNSRMKNPVRYRKEFKRDLGASEPYHIGDMELMPEDLYRELLKYFRVTAEERLGGNIERVVITHPANYAGYKKELIKKAALMSGLSKAELIDEPTAAAVYYASKEKVEIGEKILVYDLGGGTFDVSLIEKSEKGFMPLTAPLGIERCGGVDFQRKIYEDIIDNFSDEIRPMLSSGTIGARQFAFMLEAECIKIKHHLSTADKAEAVINLPGSFEFKTYEITREKFESMIKDDIEATCAKIQDIVKNAGMEMKDINKILLVGGSSRIPYIEEMVSKITGKSVSKDADTELVVALGAAIYADSLDIKNTTVEKRLGEGIDTVLSESKPNEEDTFQDKNRTQIESTAQNKNGSKEESTVLIENEDKGKNAVQNENKLQEEQTANIRINELKRADEPLKKEINLSEIPVPEMYRNYFRQSEYTNSEIAAFEIGSCFCRIAYIDEEKEIPNLILNSKGSGEIPTAICFHNGQCITGELAKRIGYASGAVVYTDVNNLIRLDKKVDINGEKYDPELLYAFLIQRLKEEAESTLKKSVRQIILVTPMYFTHKIKRRIIQVARLAGVEILKFLDSCSANSITYGFLHPSEKSNILLCNMGGESSETAIVNINEGEVKITHKIDTLLSGGNEHTRSIVNYAISSFKRSSGIDLTGNLVARHILYAKAEACKRELLTSFNTKIQVDNIVSSINGMRSLIVDLKKSDYASMTAALTNEISNSCVLGRGFQKSINKIVLFGEGADTPLVKERINALSGKDVVTAQGSRYYGVLGGAIQIGIITGVIKHITVIDCINKSISIKTSEGKREMLIPKSTTIPARITKVVRRADLREIIIVEGDSDEIKSEDILERISLTEILSTANNEGKVEITVEVLEDSEITVKINS